MSRIDERAVARKLAERDDIEPPAGLLEKIRSEIPAEIRVSPELARSTGAAPEDAGMPRRQRWLIAASLVAAVGAGVLGWELRGRAPSMESVAMEAEKEDAAAAPRDAAGNEAPLALKQAPASAPDYIEDAVEETALEPAPSVERQQAPLAPAERSEGRRQEAARIRTTPSAPPPLPAAPKPAPERQVFSEEMTVTGVSTALETSTIAENFDYESEVEALPITPRDMRSAASLSPGTSSGPASGTLSISGRPSYDTSLILDGAEVSDPFFATAAPDDQRYRDVFFKAHGTNPFVDTEDDRLSTFGLDVDTGSYTVARRFLGEGHLPDPDSVRVEEWVNYFRYGDRPPSRGDFALTAEGASTPYTLGGRYRLVRFNIRGREVDPRDRKPAVLTFVVDVSGSMDLENRLGLVKKSLGLLLDKLREGDRIGLVVYGSRGQVLLEPSGDREAVRRAIDRLVSEGSTNAEEGLVMGYDVASRHFREGAINRVILCSDGVANVGATGPDSILQRIGREARRGIELTTLGFGMGNYNDVLMEQLANKGDGRYAYIDDLEEARRVLVEELTGTLQTIAKDAKVQVEWDPQRVASYRLLGYENRDIADEKFRDDTVDAGEIGAGHSVTALYEIKLRPGVEGGRPLGTLRLRWRSPESGEVSEVEKELRLSDLSPSWDKASPALRLAASVAEMAEILKGSYWAKGSSIARVFREVQRLGGPFAGNVEVAEFVSLAGKAARLKARAAEEPR